MRELSIPAWLLTFYMVGMCLMGVAYSTVITSDHRDVFWREEAIKNNAAYYHPVTGKFTWGNLSVSMPVEQKTNK
jgi:hypothetical protein